MWSIENRKGWRVPAQSYCSYVHVRYVKESIHEKGGIFPVYVCLENDDGSVGGSDSKREEKRERKREKVKPS